MGGRFYTLGLAVVLLAGCDLPNGEKPQEREERIVKAAAQKQAEAQAAQTPADRIKIGEDLLKRCRARETWDAANWAGKKPKEARPEASTPAERNKAKAALLLVVKGQSEYPKAQQLIKEIEAQAKRAALAESAEKAKIHAALRKMFASQLEEGFLQKRMDTKVTASGPANTTLTITWILAGRVTANDLSESGVIDRAETAGFKKVIFRDGYSKRWSWDLTKSSD